LYCCTKAKEKKRKESKIPQFVLNVLSFIFKIYHREINLSMSGDGFDVEGLYHGAAAPSTGGPSAGPGITREVRQKEVFGRRPIVDSRIFRHDVLEARASPPVSWHLTKDDRLPAEEVGDKLQEIYKMFGVQYATPAEIEAVNDAILFAHTINSGSVLQPGRSKVKIKGNEFQYLDVVEFLGTDLRRFYRTLADDVRRVNKKVLAGRADADNIEAQERYQWLIEVARDRDLSRYPDLAHDSSGACWGLTPNESAAISAAKKGVFSSILNTADTISSNSRVKPKEVSYLENPAVRGIND
jgi:hypothetical protein